MEKKQKGKGPENTPQNLQVCFDLLSPDTAIKPTCYLKTSDIVILEGQRLNLFHLLAGTDERRIKKRRVAIQEGKPWFGPAERLASNLKPP